MCSWGTFCNAYLKGQLRTSHGLISVHSFALDTGSPLGDVLYRSMASVCVGVILYKNNENMN